MKRLKALRLYTHTHTHTHTDNFREKGITLIALAVTIAVIMILAGISINAIVGDDGLIKKAQKSADLSNEAEAKETINRAILEFYTSREYATLYDFLKTKVKNGTIDKVDKNSDGTLTISKNGYTVNSENKTQSTSKNNSSGAGENTGGTSGGTSGGSSDGTSGGTGSSSGSGSGSSTDIKVPATATTETAPYFPDSTFTKKEGTIDTGLVIQDSAGNEYVWVVVPRTTTVYATTGLGKTTFTETDYASIETDLKNYTSTYRNGTSYSDTWYADTDNVGWLTSDEYTELKNKMLKSVYLNGGFYVGRYEAGIETNRTSNTDKNSDNKYTTPTTAPVTKTDAYPYTWVTRTQAQKLAENVNSGNYTSGLMFGVQWDLILAFMSKDSSKISNDLTELKSNSTSIGNYRYSAFKLNTNSKYAVYSNSSLSTTWNPATTATSNFVDSSSNKISQTSGNGILVTTGTSEQNKVMNIYDIAGNVWEWTLEKTSHANALCASRGGVYNYTGSSYPASYRACYDTANSFSSIGFRVSLW